MANETAWEARWASRLEDAGITSAADKTDLIEWLRAANSPAHGATAAAAGPAHTTLRALESAGVVVSDAQRVAVESVMATSKAGSVDEQCTSRRCAWMILTGEDASAEDAVWWDSQHAALGGSDGGTINVVGRKSYQELHKTTTTKFAVLTLDTRARAQI